MDARMHAATLALTASLSLPALADGTDQPASAGASAAHRLGDHPAVIVARLEKDKPYDYAAQFYPHPAWLAMLPKAPPEASAPLVAATKAPKKVSARSGAPAASSAPVAITGSAQTGATAVAATATPARQ